MKLPLTSLVLAAVVSLAACSGGSSDGAGGPVPPVAPAPPAAPVPTELAALARAGMGEPEDAAPKQLNDLELIGNEDNPSEFDDWFQ